MKAIEIIRCFASGEIEHEKSGVCYIDKEAKTDIKALFGDVLPPLSLPRESYYLWYWVLGNDVPDFGRADYCLIPCNYQNERIYLFAIEN